MFNKRFILITGLAMAGFIMTACGTASGQGINPSAQSPPDQQADTGQDEGADTIIDVTPLSEEEIANQGVGQTEPGAGADDPGKPGEKDPGKRAMSGQTTTHKDEIYKFQIDYPVDFVFSILTADKLSALEPRPDTAFSFMNPTIAASDVIDTEIPDLEIRVYKLTGAVDSLESWLKSVGLLSDSKTARSFETPHVRGLEVCGSTMIFPNCSYFILGDGFIYQFIIASRDGEDMMNTFAILP